MLANEKIPADQRQWLVVVEHGLPGIVTRCNSEINPAGAGMYRHWMWRMLVATSVATRSRHSSCSHNVVTGSPRRPSVLTSLVNHDAEHVTCLILRGRLRNGWRIDMHGACSEMCWTSLRWRFEYMSYLEHAQCGASSRSAVERECIQRLYLSSCRDTGTRSPKPWADRSPRPRLHS